MLAAKSFEATADMVALTRWLGILADELSERMTTDIQLNQRYPRLLVLSYRFAPLAPPSQFGLNDFSYYFYIITHTYIYITNSIFITLYILFIELSTL